VHYKLAWCVISIVRWWFTGQAKASST